MTHLSNSLRDGGQKWHSTSSSITKTLSHLKSQHCSPTENNMNFFKRAKLFSLSLHRKKKYDTDKAQDKENGAL